MNPIQNSPVHRLIAVVGLVLTSFWMSAAEPEASATQEDQVEPGSEAIRAGERIKSNSLSLTPQNTNPAEFLEKALLDQGIEPGWVDDKQRWVEVTESSIPIQAPVNPKKVIRMLNIINLKLYIEGARQFSRWLGLSNSFEANLSVGGSPVSRRFKGAQEKFQLQMDELQKQLADAQSKLQKSQSISQKEDAQLLKQRERLSQSIAQQQKIVEDLNKRAQFGPSTLQRLAIAGDALLSKIDTNYTAANFRKVNADQAQAASEKLEELTAKKKEEDAAELAAALDIYAEQQKRIEQLVEEIKNKKEEAQEFYDNYRETTLTTKYNYSALYDIVGLTPIKYSYGLVPKEGGGVYLKAAAAFAWSPALERDTRAILHETGSDAVAAPYKERFRPSDLSAKRGSKSVGQWLNEQRETIDTFGMGKWYVDKDGKRFWLGCAYAIEGGGANADVSLRNVEADAQRNLGLCLNFRFQVEGSKSESTVFDADDSEGRDALKEASRMIRSGLDSFSKGISGTFRMPLSDGSQSESIRFYVVKTSVDDVRAAYKGVLQQAESAARAYDAQYIRIGQRQAANEAVRRSQQDRSPVARGRAEASKELQTKNRDDSPRSKGVGGGLPQANSLTYRPATNKVNKSGTVDPFIRVDTSKVPDDF
jgi:hypothetical protein